MYKRMGTRGYISLAALIAAIFWMAEALIHSHISIDGGKWFKTSPADFEVIPADSEVIPADFEMIPVDFDEFCMRSIIVILIIGFGIYVDYSTTIRDGEADERKRRHKAAFNKIKHRFSDFIEKVQNFNLEVRKTRSMDKDILNSFADTIHDAKDLLAKLENEGDITAEYKIPADKPDTDKK